MEDEPIFSGVECSGGGRTVSAFQLLADVLARHRRATGGCWGTGSEGGGQRYQELKDHPHVWLGKLGFTEYVHELKRAMIAVDLCQPSMERTLSSDLRTGTALWSGTPVWYS